MSLPNELLLDILGFLDYNSIVPAKFVDSTLLRLVTQNAEGLARQRHVAMLIQNSYITYNDDSSTARRYTRYDPDAPESFSEACHRLASMIGHHIVDLVQFMDNTWNRPYILAIFAVSAVKYASKLDLFAATRYEDVAFATEATIAAFFGLFVCLRSVDMTLYANIDDFHWSLLHSDKFRRLRSLKIRNEGRTGDNFHDDLLRYCSASPNQCDAERLLDLYTARFPAAFIKRLIKHMTIKFRSETQLELAEEELQQMRMTYERVPSTSFPGFIRRYASHSGCLTADVDLDNVVIRVTSVHTRGPMPRS